jgi:hypothetical protein
MQYEIVGYAPDAPQTWWNRSGGGRAACDRAADQLLGDGALRHGFEAPLSWQRDDPPRIGIRIFEPVIMIAWSGVPDSSLRWDRLVVDPSCHRFHVGVFPASDGLEVSWTSPEGELLRRVSIDGGTVMADEGEARLFAEDEDGVDASLRVEDDLRLPKKVVQGLIASAAADELKLYDGRRYVRTEDRSVIKKARIVHVDDHGKSWVAVDQKGPVNLLGDPLHDLSRDVEEIAEQLLRAWFRIDLSDEHDEALKFNTYCWPDHPMIKDLAAAVVKIRQDRKAFFTLLGAADQTPAADLIAQRYDVAPRTAYDLLALPLDHFLPAD